MWDMMGPTLRGIFPYGVTSFCQSRVTRLRWGADWLGFSAGVGGVGSSAGTAVGESFSGLVPHFPSQGGSLILEGSFSVSGDGSLLGTTGRATVGSSSVSDISWGGVAMSDISWSLLVVVDSVSSRHGSLSTGTSGLSPWTLHGGLSSWHLGPKWLVRALLQVGTDPEEKQRGASPIANHVPSPHRHRQRPDPGPSAASPPHWGKGQGRDSFPSSFWGTEAVPAAGSVISRGLPSAISFCPLELQQQYASHPLPGLSPLPAATSPQAGPTIFSFPLAPSAPQALSPGSPHRGLPAAWAAAPGAAGSPLHSACARQDAPLSMETAHGAWGWSRARARLPLAKRPGGGVAVLRTGRGKSLN